MAEASQEWELAAEDTEALEAEEAQKEEAKASRKRPRVQCHDLKKMFNAPQAAAPVASPARVGLQQPSITLSAFHLREVTEEVREVALMETDGESLERRVLSAPVPLKELMEPVMLLEAVVPLLESGQAVFRKLPKQWLDITGNSTALGTRCLFTSRRSEFSVLQVPERFIQVPPAAKGWQMEMVPSESFTAACGEKLPAVWSVQIQPELERLRVLVRPGALLLRMLRRGNALPAARFVWRVQDAQVQAQEVPEGECADVGEFSILSNREDPVTTQPASFLHPLRIEQLRSLGWMLNQERPSKEAFATELTDSEACPDAAHWHLEGSLRCEYHDVRGGVLADAIGYGKTACTIGLIDKTKDLPPPRVPMPYRGFVASRATLVLAPTNLHMQWLAEIEKFTGNSLKVLSIPTCAQLKRYSMKDLAEADVVVATYRLFYSQTYLQRLEELARETKLGFTFPKSAGQGTKGSGQGSAAWKQAYRSGFEALPTWSQRRLGLEDKRRRLVGKQSSQSFERKDYGTLEETYFVPLEAFWWRRLVCDEFHELIRRYPPAQTAVELFHADFKWGLSGTPPCETLAQIRKAAGFLGVQLPQGGRAEERKVAHEWIDAFVRRNTAELPAIEEEEQIVAVRQTPKERALYGGLTLQEEVEGEIKALKDGLKDGHTTTALLKLCSHFCIAGDAPSAEEECHRQMELRRNKLKAAQRDVKAFADKAFTLVQQIQNFEPFFARTLEPAAFKGYSKASLSARAKFLGVKAPSQDKAELLDQLLSVAKKRSSTARAKALGRYFDSKSCGRAHQGSEQAWEAERAWQQLLELTQGAPGEDSQALEAVGASCVRQALLDALAGGTAAPGRCLSMRQSLKMPEYADEDKALEEANWKWLNVKANHDKLLEIIDSWKVDLLSCSTRLDQLKVEVTEKAESLDSFQDSMAATQAQQSSEDVEHESGDFAKYGSKIEKLVRHVHQLQHLDKTAKMICFVQWEDLKSKVSRALNEFEVPHLTLKGGAFQRGQCLRRFQYEIEGPRMLLLSLEESASGTNLTAANHVLIVHPMEAQTKEEAVAFEMQAVGRVRRPGQKKKIHIWRFVTIDTIEQDITEEHQKELWERQQATIELSLPAAQGSLSDEEMEEPCEADDLATQGYPAAEAKELPCDPECTQAYSA